MKEAGFGLITRVTRADRSRYGTDFVDDYGGFFVAREAAQLGGTFGTDFYYVVGAIARQRRYVEYRGYTFGGRADVLDFGYYSAY